MFCPILTSIVTHNADIVRPDALCVLCPSLYWTNFLGLRRKKCLRLIQFVIRQKLCVSGIKTAIVWPF